MAIFINRAFDLTDGQMNSFKDISRDMASYQAILNMSANRIASGYPDGTYRPDQAVTRGQFSAFMARALGLVTVPAASWDGSWTNQFGSLDISNETSNRFDFTINVVMGGHVGEIEGTASVQGNTAVYTEYIEFFEGFYNDPNCRITFVNSGDSIDVKETAACSYWHGAAATFDGVFSNSNDDNQDVGDGQVIGLTYDVQSGSIKFNGVALGISQNQGMNSLGAPAEQGISEFDGALYHSYKYPDSWFSEELNVDYLNNRVSDISYTAVSSGYFLPNEKFLQAFDGKIYRETDLPVGVFDEYIFVSPTNQVLFITMYPDTSPGSGIGNFIHYYYLAEVDGNFLYWNIQEN